MGAAASLPTTPLPLMLWTNDDTPEESLVTSVKRLLQQYLPIAS